MRMEINPKKIKIIARIIIKLFERKRGLLQEIILLKSAFSIIGENYLNQPYSGTYVPLDFYEKEVKITSIMMETRADTFLTDELKIHAGFETVSKALANLVDSIRLH